MKLLMNLKKKIWDSSRIQTDGLYVSTAVLYQLSYKDPYIASLLQSTFFTYPHPFCKSTAFIYQYAWSALPVFKNWPFLLFRGMVLQQSYLNIPGSCLWETENNFWFKRWLLWESWMYLLWDDLLFYLIAKLLSYCSQVDAPVQFD